MGKIYHQWGWFGEFNKMHNCSKVEGREKKIIPKLEAFREEENHFCYVKGKCWGILEKYKVCTCKKLGFIHSNPS
jgi:hypothetical protein